MNYDANLPLWLTEDITWPVLWGFLVLGILGFIWFVTRQNRFLFATVGVLSLLIGLFVIEQRFVTDKEYLVHAINQMAVAVKSNDAEGIVQFVREDNEKMRNRIFRNLERYNFIACDLIGFNRTYVDPAGKSPRKALMGFSVWGSGALKGHPETFHSVPVVVNIEFEKRGDKWTIEDYGYKPANVPGEIEMVGGW